MFYVRTFTRLRLWPCAALQECNMRKTCQTLLHHKETDLQSLSGLICWPADVYGCKVSRKPFPPRFLSREQEWRAWCTISIIQNTLALTTDKWILSSVVLQLGLKTEIKQGFSKKKNLPWGVHTEQLSGVGISSSHFCSKVEPLPTAAMAGALRAAG